MSSFHDVKPGLYTINSADRGSSGYCFISLYDTCGASNSIGAGSPVVVIAYSSNATAKAQETRRILNEICMMHCSFLWTYTLLALGIVLHCLGQAAAWRTPQSQKHRHKLWGEVNVLIVISYILLHRQLCYTGFALWFKTGNHTQTASLQREMDNR